MYTVAKAAFLTAFDELILRPRKLDYQVQFPGPAGTIAVEAALKLARKVTGRTEVIAFTNGFHGMTLGLAGGHRQRLCPRGAPDCRWPMRPRFRSVPSLDRSTARAPDFQWLERLLEDPGSGLDLPGGGRSSRPCRARAGSTWRAPTGCAAWPTCCREHGILLIVDDVQMGCGRTGPFFSFELAGITPDIVCLSKSISGYGLPLALTLIRPDLDIWAPGEHNGTFRGINPALVTGTAALRAYWSDDTLERGTARQGRAGHGGLTATRRLLSPAPRSCARGRGLAWGLAFAERRLAQQGVRRRLRRSACSAETAGPRGQVVKLLPPLTASDDELELGLSMLASAVTRAAA